MALKFTRGAFRVQVCERGHVSLEVVDGEAVKFVAVMSRGEARTLSARLLSAAGGPRERRRLRLRLH